MTVSTVSCRIRTPSPAARTARSLNRNGSPCCSTADQSQASNALRAGSGTVRSYVTGTSRCACRPSTSALWPWSWLARSARRCGPAVPRTAAFHARQERRSPPRGGPGCYRFRLTASVSHARVRRLAWTTSGSAGRDRCFATNGAVCGGPSPTAASLPGWTNRSSGVTPAALLGPHIIPDIASCVGLAAFVRITSGLEEASTFRRCAFRSAGGRAPGEGRSRVVRPVRRRPGASCRLCTNALRRWHQRAQAPAAGRAVPLPGSSVSALRGRAASSWMYGSRVGSHAGESGTTRAGVRRRRRGRLVDLRGNVPPRHDRRHVRAALRG
jgi:hypothetical protein